MKLNILKIYLPIALIALIIASCDKKEPDQWLKDNVQVIGKLPVIATFTVKPPQTTTIAAGSNVQLDLRYWSDDPVDKINLYATVGVGTRQTVSSTPYQKAYSKVSKTDSLLLNYTVPAGLASGTSIKVDAEVLNSNTLSKTSSITLKVQ